MKLGFFALAALTLASAGAAQDTSRQTRVVVEDGKTMTVTGCVQRSHEGNFTLTNAAGKEGSVGSYVLVRAEGEDDLDDLGKHVGHRVEVTGKAADRGDGKITVETKNEVKRADGGKAKTESKSEVKGDLAGLPYLGVKSFRMIAAVCP